MTIKEAEKVDILDTIDIEYKPATVSFNDFEAFKNGIEQVISQFGTFDLEVNTIEDVKGARTKLNTLDKKLEDRRKEIKKAINDPYAEFEKQYKVPYNKLLALRTSISNQINEYEANQKTLRKDIVKTYLYEKATEADLRKEVFDQYLDNFKKASDFTDTFKIKKATKDKLDEIVFIEIEKQNQKDADLMAITGQCAKYNLGPVTYIRNYENGASLAEILGYIERDADSAKQALEIAEAKQKAEEQRKAELAEQAKLKATQSIKAVDHETGEILEPIVVAKYETTIKFIMDLEQAQKFKSFLDENDFEFETLVGMKKIN